MEDLDYADDFCLLSDTQSKMQNKINSLNDNSLKTGLKINVLKTKFMAITGLNDSGVTLNGINIEKVTQFNYLGSMISEKGGTDVDIKIRIGKVQGTFNTLKRLWSNSNISTKTKLRIFNSNVKSVQLYGVES